MTAQKTDWLEYGDPVDGERRVEATKRTTYQTGPNESRDDDVTRGTLSFEGLALGWGEGNDTAEHVHDDGSLCLSALDAGKREAIMAEFESMDD